MQTFPSGVTIKLIATYTNDNGDTITVSKRFGGIGADDYLVAGPGGFTATCKTQDRATEAARAEIARLARKAENDAQTS